MEWVNDHHLLDGALLKVFGLRGMGLFASAVAVAKGSRPSIERGSSEEK